MKKLVVFFIAVLLLSCNTDNEKDIKYRNIQMSKVVIDTSLLEGVWAENEDDNANFYIKDGAMYTVEDQDVPIKIEVVGDTLITFYSDDMMTKDYIKRLTTDSLILVNTFNDTLKLYKR